MFMRGVFLMTEFVRFMERPGRPPVHPNALAAMQQTGEMVPQKQRSGSQRFLQGGLSTPITVTWEITAECSISCLHCLSSSGHRPPRDLNTEQALAPVVELADMQY